MANSADDVDIDMEEWEVLVPDDVAFSDELRFNPGEVDIDMDHFTCPSEDTKHHVVPLVLLEKKNSNEEAAAAAPPHHVVIFTGGGQNNAVSVSEFPQLDTTTKNPELSIPHQEILPNIKFEDSPKLMDMKKMMESPKSLLLKNNEEGKETEVCQEEEEYAAEGKKHKAVAACCDVNILGWRVSGGISALCSIGVAAATICMIILGGQQQRQRQQQQRHQNQRLQFQIYTDDKRIEQVMQQATRLNQALSVVRGVPITRANISFGGSYDGL